MRKEYEDAGKLQTRLIRAPRNSCLTKLCTAINVPVVLHSHEDRTAIMLKYRQSRNIVNRPCVRKKKYEPVTFGRDLFNRKIVKNILLDRYGYGNDRRMGWLVVCSQRDPRNESYNFPSYFLMGLGSA
ncbi:hypothetical protein M0804_010697 [Polistes exclamans]|nr:hypothetical protein M0804_010697 [Polistes exclamans]